MITDDPGTPGNGHWENNLAIAFEHRPNEWLIDAPAIDLNYGWGDHIQLTLQTSCAVLKQNERGAVAGVGGTEAAVKWRFLDEERSEFLYGIVGGTEISKRTTIMAELHGTSRTNFTRDRLTLNFGWRHKINEQAVWIVSLGYELRAPDDEQLALIGYCGVQFLY